MMSQYDADVEDLESFDRSVKESSLRAIVADLELELRYAVDEVQKHNHRVHLNMFKEALEVYDKENALQELRSHLASQNPTPETLSKIQSIDADLSLLALELKLYDLNC